ncbi:hypothetical protein A2U01_0068363, partial [Trifolium medium]|nr:hypothetical protein [Trifolium medium]
MSLRDVSNTKKLGGVEMFLKWIVQNLVTFVRSGMNWSNKLRELLDEELLDRVFVVEASLRL